MGKTLIIKAESENHKSCPLHDPYDGGFVCFTRDSPARKRRATTHHAVREIVDSASSYSTTVPESPEAVRVADF